MKTLSYLNDKKLKREMVAEMKEHKKLDAFMKGTYAKQNGYFRGCAVGCGVESLNLKRGLHIKHDDHKGYSAALGIPEWLARLEDLLFENLPEKESKEFPVKFIESIPVGVDLEPVKWKFCVFILKENIERVLSLKEISNDLKKQVVDAIRGVLAVHEKAISSGVFNDSADSARSAAYLAAWSAAYLAARSAAYLAAWSAAYLAARSAAYIRYANHLLKLLKQEGK